MGVEIPIDPAAAPAAGAPVAGAPAATAPEAATPADAESAAVAPAAPAGGAPAAPVPPRVPSFNDGSANSAEAVHAQVVALKTVLDDKAAAPEAVLEALCNLRALGAIPTKVLGDTLVGKSVNQLAKASSDEAVKAKARELVEEWRQTHRKRKSSSGDLTPALKRSASSTANFDSLSQESTGAGQGASQGDAQGAGDGDASQGAAAGDKDGQDESQSALQKQDSTVSLGEPGASAKGLVDDKQRDKVRQKMVEALGKAEAIETKGEDQGDEKMRDPVMLATDIEQELFNALPKKEAYMNQARSILYNLKDAKNYTFRFKLMVGYYKPKDVPGLSAEDMATDEKNAQRAKHRQDAMDAIDAGWAMKNGQMQLTGMFTCGKCKGTKTTYFQMQTRSSDEPMTTFVTCLTCNNRWKFC